MFKKRECKHCKLSKAVANDAADQFNKAESALKVELLRNQFLKDQNERLTAELGKWKHWWYLEKKVREEHAALLVDFHNSAMRLARKTETLATVDYFNQHERST